MTDGTEQTADRVTNGDNFASRHDREMAARALAAAAAEGHLGDEELESRLARTHEARTYDDLEQLLADLPGAQEPEERTIAEHTVPETLHVTASLRKARRHGRWRAPGRIVASAGMGEVEFDFTEAELTAGGVTVDARPNVSNVELIVPQNYAVSTEQILPGAEPVHDHTTPRHTRTTRPGCTCRPGPASAPSSCVIPSSVAGSSPARRAPCRRGPRPCQDVPGRVPGES